MFATGETVNLAEWIIDDTSLIAFNLISVYQIIILIKLQQKQHFFYSRSPIYPASIK